VPTVPRISGPSVAPAGIPDVRQQNPNDADLLSIGARQAQQAGNAMVGAGAQMEVIRRDALDRANAIRVDDALNLATEHALRLQHDPKEGYSTQKGFAALNRESGMPLADEYTGKLDEQINGIAGTLGNDEQRRMFQMRANNIRTQFFGGALQYESKENTDYTVSVRDATVKNASNALVLNYTSPENVQDQVTRIQSAILGGKDPATGAFVPGSAQMQGKSAAWGQEEASKVVSSAHLNAIRSAMESGNVNAAMGYRKRYGDQMTAADMIQIDGALQRDYDVRQGSAVASNIVSATRPLVDPTNFDRLTNIIQQNESRGQAFGADGKLLQGPVTRSGERAQGDMQVMPSTASDPGYGIKPADMSGTPVQQAAELRRVGREKLSVLVKMYDGDIAKASAAYNWGEGNVNKAMQQAKEAAGKGEAVPTDAWLAYAPSETRKYVASTLKQLSSPEGGVPPRPTLEQLHTAARNQLGAGASPLAVKTAVDTISQQYEDQTKALTQRRDETVTLAMQQLTQNGGRFSELPSSTRSALARFAPEKMDEVMNYGQRMAKGDDTTDDRLYLRLTTDPQAMARMSDAQFFQLRQGLSKSDFDQFARQRADIQSGKSSNTPGDLNTSAVSRVTNARLQSMGIDPTPKDGSADAQRVGAIRRYVDAAVLDAQRQTGKKFDDAQVQAQIDALFAKNVQFRTSFLGFNTGTSGQPMLGMKAGDIPSTQADAIKKAFKARGNDNPTDAEVLGAYWAGKTAATDLRSGTF
jgi:hypothetical protein